MMTPVRPELPHFTGELFEGVSGPNESKLVLFNNSNFGYELAETGRINIWLDEKAVGGPNVGEYIQLPIAKGKHQLRLVHLDVVKLESSHEIEVHGDTMFIEMRATPLSNDIKIHDQLPSQDDLPRDFKPYVHLD